MRARARERDVHHVSRRETHETGNVAGHIQITQDEFVRQLTHLADIMRNILSKREKEVASWNTEFADYSRLSTNDARRFDL